MPDLSVLGTIGSAAINAISQSVTNAQNRRQANEAYAKQQEAIRRMNEYNSPAQQTLRMKAAGLNPALAYGADGPMVGNQSDIPEYQAIPAEAPRVTDIGAAMRDASRLGLEAREQINRNNRAIAEVALMNEQAFMAATSGGLNLAQTEELFSLLGYKIQDYENKFTLDEARYNEIQQNIAESASRIGLNDAQVRELDSLVDLNNVKAHEIMYLLPSRLRNMDAQTLMYQMNAGLLNGEISKVAQEVESIQFARTMQGKEFNFEVKKYNNSLKMWRAEQRISIEQQHADRVTSIFRVLLGGAMIRKGVNVPASNQRQPSPILTPSGTREFGQSWVQ